MGNREEGCILFGESIRKTGFKHYRLKTKEAYRGNATGASPVRGGYASRTIPEEMTRQKVAWLKYQEKTGRNTPQVRHRAEALPQGIQGERPEIYSYSQHIGHIGRVSEARANSSPAERGRQKAIQDAKKAAQAKQRQKAEAVAEEKLSIWIPDTKKLRQEGEVPVGRAATAAGRQMQGRTGSTALRQKGSQVQSQLKQKRTLPAMELRTKTLTPSAQLKEAPQKLAGSVPVAVSRRMRIRAQKQALQRAQQSAAHKAKTAMQKAAKRSAKGGKAAARVMASLLRALCSTVSGIILLLTLTFAVAVGSVIASPFGIFFAGESHDPGTITLTEAVAQVNEDYAARLEELQDGGYDQININGSPPDWREVIAVFACKTAGAEEDGMDVVTMDAERVERLKEVFWDMTIITTSVEVIHHPDSSPEENDGWTERILHITIEAKTADEMREFYHFTKYQNGSTGCLAGRARLHRRSDGRSEHYPGRSHQIAAKPAGRSFARAESRDPKGFDTGRKGQLFLGREIQRHRLGQPVGNDPKGDGARQQDHRHLPAFRARLFGIRRLGIQQCLGLQAWPWRRRCVTA